MIRQLQMNFDFKILHNYYNDFLEVLPKVVGGIVFIILSWLLLKLILFIAKKSLKLTKIDSLLENVNDKNPIFGDSVKIKPTKIILAFLKWFLILILAKSQLSGGHFSRTIKHSTRFYIAGFKNP